MSWLLLFLPNIIELTSASQSLRRAQACPLIYTPVTTTSASMDVFIHHIHREPMHFSTHSSEAWQADSMLSLKSVFCCILLGYQGHRDELNIFPFQLHMFGDVFTSLGYLLLSRLKKPSSALIWNSHFLFLAFCHFPSFSLTSSNSSICSFKSAGANCTQTLIKLMFNHVTSIFLIPYGWHHSSVTC